MQTAGVRFPYNTPSTKEGCYFRTIFHSHFPNNNYGNGIETTVPGGPSVACSTAKAIEWDASFQNSLNQVQPRPISPYLDLLSPRSRLDLAPISPP